MSAQRFTEPGVTPRIRATWALVRSLSGIAPCALSNLPIRFNRFDREIPLRGGGRTPSLLPRGPHRVDCAALFAPLDKMMLAFIAFLALVAATVHPEPTHFLVLLALLALALTGSALWGADPSSGGWPTHSFPCPSW